MYHVHLCPKKNNNRSKYLIKLPCLSKTLSTWAQSYWEKNFVTNRDTLLKKLTFIIWRQNILIILVMWIELTIMINKRGRQCNAGREWSTRYQSKGLSLTIPTHRQKKRKVKIKYNKNEYSSLGQRKALILLLKPASPSPSITGSARLFLRYT